VLALRTDGIHPASIGDDHLGGYLATRKLIDHGHRRIGLVMDPEHATTAVQRRAGYRAALSEAGIGLDDCLIAGDAYTMEAGETAADTLLNRPDPPTAIFAVNDNNAIGVMAAAANRGLRIPDDLSVIGYNDIPVASKLPVPLTTIREPFNLIARGAIDLIVDQTRTGPGDIPTIVATPTLIPRGSTSPQGPLKPCDVSRLVGVSSVRRIYWRIGSLILARLPVGPRRSLSSPVPARVLRSRGSGTLTALAPATPRQCSAGLWHLP
jgi:LacI family transcriptional regulator